MVAYLKYDQSQSKLHLDHAGMGAFVQLLVEASSLCDMSETYQIAGFFRALTDTFVRHYNIAFPPRQLRTSFSIQNTRSCHSALELIVAMPLSGPLRHPEPLFQQLYQNPVGLLSWGDGVAYGGRWHISSIETWTP